MDGWVVVLLLGFWEGEREARSGESKPRPAVNRRRQGRGKSCEKDGRLE